MLPGRPTSAGTIRNHTYPPNSGTKWIGYGCRTFGICGKNWPERQAGYCFKGPERHHPDTTEPGGGCPLRAQYAAVAGGINSGDMKRSSGLSAIAWDGLRRVASVRCESAALTLPDTFPTPFPIDLGKTSVHLPARLIRISSRVGRADELARYWFQFFICKAARFDPGRSRHAIKFRSVDGWKLSGGNIFLDLRG